MFCPEVYLQVTMAELFWQVRNIPRVSGTFLPFYHSAERADLHFTFESQEGLCKREGRWNVSPRPFMTATLHCFGLTLFYVGIEIRNLVLLRQHPSNITYLAP
jgi:hypothetical protein